MPPGGLRFIDNLLVRIHFITVMIRWTGLAPLEFEFPFPNMQERAEVVCLPVGFEGVP